MITKIYKQLHAVMVLIKSLYFESGSKNLEPEERYSENILKTEFL